MHLIDFGIAIRLRSVGLVPASPTTLEGTLAYISPEQTGRVNRGVDARSDLYSLGVTLFEMLTSTLPFTSTEPGELLHSHIARQPALLRSLRASVPEALANIVAKLLNKMAEDRYQSAFGLRSDLQECLKRWQSDHTIPEFALGSHDRPGELRLPQKLYGQRPAREQLTAALDRVRGGALELVLLSGQAGSGKTALVSELLQPLAHRGGYLARAGFDPQQQGIPYGPLLSACRDLLRQLLTEPAHSLQTRKERFLQMLGENGQILIELLPELELVIGPQPAVAALPPAESQNRFGLLFQNFLRQFASAQHPLVLFLDDLHFADPASLQLLRLLLTDPYGHYLLVVGAYREPTATDDAHPLQQQLAALRKERIATTTISLTPLQLTEVTQLLADALFTPPAALTELAELAQEILTKTHGSPFFVHQFLGSLCRDQLLSFDASAREWRWDLASIQALTATDNVADFMVATLQRLGPGPLQILQQAACIGTQFDLPTLVQIGNNRPDECAAALAEAMRVGLLVPLESAYHPTEHAPSTADREKTPVAEPAVAYQFVHERVQQAAYAMLGESYRQDLHLQIGRRRLATTGSGAPSGKLFDLVNHLNLGSPRILASGDAQELMELARLNLLAGQRAKSTAAFHAASGFFTAATGLLPESAWDSQPALLLELHLERAHSETLIGRFDEAEALLRALGKRTRSPIEGGLVQLRLCELYCTRGEFAQGTQAGIAGLAQLGIILPTTAADIQAAFLAERATLTELIGQRRIMDLVDLPLNQSSEIDLAVSLIAALILAVYLSGSPPLYPLLVARQMTLALRFGVCDQTSYAFSCYGFLLGTILGEPAEANQFGKLALALNQKFPNAAMACRIRMSLGAFMHYCEPLKDCIDSLEVAQKQGLAAGDFVYLSMVCSSRAQLFYYTCADLNSALRETEEYLVLMQRTNDALSTMQLTQTRQLLLALVGRTTEPTSLGDADFDEVAVWQGLRQANAIYPLNMLSGAKIMLLYLFRKYEQACTLGLESEAWFSSAPGFPFHTERVFLLTLSLVAHYPSLPEQERGNYDLRIDRYHQQLRTWTGHCAANYQHRERLVAAERARLAGQFAEATMLFDEAIDAAHRNGFPLHEALAHECAGRFHATAGRDRLASYYLIEALYCYMHLGATAKANALVAEHPDHLRAETRALKGLTPLEAATQGTTSSTGSRGGAEDQLDVNMVLRAAEGISRELALDKVIEQVLHTVLSSAGGQRGFLILDRNGTLQIEAARTLSPDSSRMGLGLALDSLVDSEAPVEELAFSVVHYVVRTRQVVALNAATPDTRFANDAYLLKTKPRAVLCLPLINQGRLTGLLYLENNLAQVTFSPSRIDLLRILSAQAATALENALLLHRIHEATEKIRRTNEVLETQVAERTEEIQRSNTELQLTNQRLQVELLERGKAERERATLQEQMLQAERDRARLQEQMLHAERERAALQDKMLHAQSERLAELATPIIPITERIMVMPLIGAMEAERAGQLIEVALNGAQHSGAQVVILDITGLRHIDTSVADSLLKTARALRLVGAHAIITGIRAVVAQTLVSLGVDLSSMETRSTLQSAIAYALKYTGESLRLKGS